MKCDPSPRRRVPLSALAVAAALTGGLALGCAESTADNRATEDQSRYRFVECLHVIDVVSEPGPRYQAHGSGGGFVALPTGTLQLGRSGSEGSGYEDYRFAKLGLLVRHARQASLEIASAPGEAFLDYGDLFSDHGDDVSGSADALTAGPCNTHGPACEANSAEYVGGWPCGADRGEWMVWAGGIWVNEPSCVEVLVSSEDEEIPVWLAVGAPCDGRT